MGRILRLARFALPVAGSLRTNAVRRGLLGGSRLWQVVGISLLLQGFWRKYGGKTTETVAVEELRRGNSIQITALHPRELRRR